ncbi:U4/U6.U5 small nuclear ribonucleoprotein 27 kDa protein [Ischnura elegans]|uniref:U4/U6.U5 small nuclear ribonucleoprotein 27 kDa protein n=1 Tax=Ischnura elegans TaxID=197161 RepID=UPI001ED86873|nr:U4/U6.U5 small nuclear ribonucleoprotein 27 kDa protein [Ischnura elegans]XP_046385530.1 U4/U6.U5 small nuclear ribonucleoprotein 27 kDa protein [Ischnura elegans]
MGYSRSPSPSRRRRSKSRERDRRRRRSRERSRDRSRDRDRRRRSADRNDSGGRHRRSWSRSRSRSTSRGRDGSKRSSSHLAERPSISAQDLEGKSPEEQEMMKMMGFCAFDTTKGKKVNNTEVGTVHVILKRKYRQYMNRKGGFNRPLDFVA